MAGVLDQDTVKVVIKKEIEDVPPSPEHTDVPDSSPQNQSEANGFQKHSKVTWGEDVTRSLIEIQKKCLEKFKDGNYSKKQLLDDVAAQLNLIGYETTPEKVRNKMKYLRNRYKLLLDYNARHVEKKTIPFQDELSELYSMDFFDDEPLFPKSPNGSSISVRSSNENVFKRAKSLPASHVDLRTVVTPKKRNSAISKASKILKKKVHGKRTGALLFQCGLCMNKFRTSYDMHDHVCKSPAKKGNTQINENSNKKRVQNSGQAQAFHWNSLITMQFLDLLKDFQNNHKQPTFKKGNIWDNISILMKRLGYKIHPRDLLKKWDILSNAYEKTVIYNSTHKDKKRCAFYKRLMDLHNHPLSFDCFKMKNGPTKRTVEVSPFSYSHGATLTQSTSASYANNYKDMKEKDSNMSELISWLNNTWTEYKEMERHRQELENQRHNEIMEMLSYLVDTRDKR